LWKTGGLNTTMAFSSMHLDSILRGEPTLEGSWNAEEDESGD
jgi:hypothetical protein